MPDPFPVSVGMNIIILPGGNAVQLRVVVEWGITAHAGPVCCLAPTDDGAAMRHGTRAALCRAAQDDSSAHSTA